LPEAAQYARSGQPLPRGWLEIGEMPKRVKEMGVLIASSVTPAKAGVPLRTSEAGFRPAPE
jgi:hypothetical protein